MITLRDIEALVAQFEASDWRRIEFIAEGIELRLSKDAELPTAPTPTISSASPTSAPSLPAVPPTPPSPPAQVGQLVTAASLGTFYRAPKPGEPPFVAIGEHVAVGQDLCLIEVMKLFTTVTAPISGTILAIHAGDGELVEFGQPLISIDPDA